MKRLLGDWITDLEGTCDLLALDGQRQRYAYFGFTPGSEKYTFYLDVANVRHTWKNGELSAYTFAPLFPENGEADEEAAAFAKKLNEEKPLYVVREDVKACLKTFGEQAIAIWKNGERIGYLALCGGNQVVEAEVLEEQDFVPALAAYLKENALDSLFISIPVYETGKAAALSEVCESFTKERCGSAMYRIFQFADVIEAMLTMKAETMGISDGTWFAVLEGQPLTVTVKDGTVTVTREAHPWADVLNREQAQELLLSPLASKGSKVPSEIWKNIPSDWFPLPLYCAAADEFWAMTVGRQRNMNETEKRDRRDEKEEIRYHVIFYGQVQGVGFRYRAYYAAYQLGLTGWVRNCWDETVEMEVQGDEETITEMIKRIRTSSYIEITDAKWTKIPLESEFGFHIR